MHADVLCVEVVVINDDLEDGVAIMVDGNSENATSKSITVKGEQRNSWAAACEKAASFKSSTWSTPSSSSVKAGTSSAKPPQCVTPAASNTPEPVSAGGGAMKPIVFNPAKRPDKPTLESLGKNTMWGFIDKLTSSISNDTSTTVQQVQQSEPVVEQQKKRPAAPAANPKSKKAKQVPSQNENEGPQPSQKKAAAAPTKQLDEMEQMRQKAKQALAHSVERATWNKRFTASDISIYADELVLKAPPPKPLTGNENDKGRRVPCISMW